MAIDMEMGVTETASVAIDTNTLSQEQRGTSTTIYKVPTYLRELNPEEFTPELVSFGPYHHESKELQLMKVHKKRALLHFVRRANKSFGNIVGETAEIIKQLRDVYSCLDDKWKVDGDAFLEMLILDGCFMLELLCFSCLHRTDYSSIDPFFSPRGLMIYKTVIVRDMLLIENQVPLHLLKILIAFQTLHPQDAANTDRYVKNLLIGFLEEKEERNINAQSIYVDPTMHLLDLYRRNLLLPNKEHQITKSPSVIDRVRCPSMVELQEAGVRLKKSNTTCLNDIHFNSKTGTFHLPRLTVHGYTRSTMLNMIVFEQLNVNVDKMVTSYIAMMVDIVDSANDIRVLCDNDIILKLRGNKDKDDARSFDGILKKVMVDIYSNSMMDVRRDLSRFCSKKRNTWLAYFKHACLKNPWTAFLLTEGLLIIILNIIRIMYYARHK